MPLTPEERQRLKDELGKMLRQWPEPDQVREEAIVAGLLEASSRAGVLAALQAMPVPDQAMEASKIAAELLFPTRYQDLDLAAGLREQLEPRDPATGLPLGTLTALRRGMGVVRKIGSPTTAQVGNVRRQHFVPRLYLRNFAQQRKKKFYLHEFSLKTFKRRRTTVEDTGLEAYYYNTRDPQDQAESLDPWLGRVETQAAPVLQQLLQARSIDALSDEDRYLLSLFIVTLAMRVPAMREVYRRASEWMLGQLKQLEARFGYADDLSYRQLRLDDNEVARAANDVIVDTALGTANLLFVRKWTLWGTDSAHPFITSDTPIVRENPFPEGTFGFMSPGLQFALPLSPTLMLLIYDRRDYPADFRTDRPVTLEPDFVRAYNFFQVEQAVRFLLSKDEHCETVFREWQQVTAPWPLRWDLLIKREPRLEELRREMHSQRDDRRAPYFCANELWSGAGDQPGYEARMLRLVGGAAETDDPVVRSAEAVAIARNVLYETLPYCRDCNCPDAEEEGE